MLRLGHCQESSRVHELSPRLGRFKRWESGVGKEERRPSEALGLSGDSERLVRGDSVPGWRAGALWGASYRAERHRGPQRWRSRNFSGSGARASLEPRPAAKGWPEGGAGAEAGNPDSHPQNKHSRPGMASPGVAQSGTRSALGSSQGHLRHRWLLVPGHSCDPRCRATFSRSPDAFPTPVVQIMPPPLKAVWWPSPGTC